jgi:hypothetical protein
MPLPQPLKPAYAARSRFHETLRAPDHKQACGYVSLATSQDDAIQAIALFRQFQDKGMNTCTYVLIVPRRPLAEQWPQHVTEDKDLVPYRTILCPVRTWLARLDVHVVLADVPFDAAVMRDEALRVRHLCCTVLDML